MSIVPTAPFLDDDRCRPRVMVDGTFWIPEGCDDEPETLDFIPVSFGPYDGVRRRRHLNRRAALLAGAPWRRHARRTVQGRPFHPAATLRRAPSGRHVAPFTPSSSLLATRGSYSYHAVPTRAATALAPARAYHAAPIARAAAALAPTRMSYHATPMRAATSLAPAPMHSMAARSRGMRGLGQAADASTGVSPRWKYATIGLIGLVVAQAIWWNNRAPGVLARYFR